ncbi:MAG: GIY-YIG nuclease family protein [Methanosarcinales archaeon]|nr:MAG: GIY-YIG nuclease family protein [Methanosarcinales archaeon]
MTKGIYTLILQLHDDVTREVGRLGVLHLKRGFYAYTGSARGTGGFKRINRHINVLSGKNTTQHWHIDYLLPKTTFRCAVISPTNQNLECTIAKQIGATCEPIKGFGCTDCSCTSHLHFTDKHKHDQMLDAVKGAHNNAGGDALIWHEPRAQTKKHLM